ncbi:hypothetical protein ACJDU8_24765 [Clostridium sp. WILCCON 0269]|uniref:CARDB domain-containing protein n=1 Tax=Candidatus Clostridium eludens TaxID=3381663 RepID=A0ABW8SV33_9CLOT
MMNAIKTAIITIIVSFISGLLFDYYKNLAPRILYNIGHGVPKKLNNKKIWTYVVTVGNISNKTIHELTVNVQSARSSIRVADEKITKGLKFDSSIRDNILDVQIPFLSKGDKFTATLYVENQYGLKDKPSIIVRSPENFKKASSAEQNGILSSLLNIPKSINEAISSVVKKPEATSGKLDDFTAVHNNQGDFTAVMYKKSDIERKLNGENSKVSREHNISTSDKKVIVFITSVLLFITAGVVTNYYFKSKDMKTPNTATNNQKQPTNTAGSSDSTSQNTDENTPSGKSTGDTDINTSISRSSRHSHSRTSTNSATDDTGSNTSSNGASSTTHSNTSSNGMAGNTNATGATDKSTGNGDSNTQTTQTNQTSQATGNASKSTSSAQTTGSSSTSTSTSIPTKNSGSSTPAAGSSGNSGNSGSNTPATQTTGSTGK